MNGSARCAGVVLAAGAGRRMGHAKALVEVGGAPLVTQAVRALVEGGCDPVGVVVGAEGEGVRRVLADHAPDVKVLDNPDWDGGMGSSVSMALAWAQSLPNASALLVLPVDTPGLGAPVVRRVVARWAEGAPAADAALVATYDGHPRNPVLLPTAVWSGVAARVHSDTGARDWLRANPDHVVEVECGDLGDPTDLDTPDDLATWNDRGAADAAAPTTGEAHGTHAHLHRPCPS